MFSLLVPSFSVSSFCLNTHSYRAEDVGSSLCSLTLYQLSLSLTLPHFLSHSLSFLSLSPTHFLLLSFTKPIIFRKDNKTLHILKFNCKYGTASQVLSRHHIVVLLYPYIWVSIHSLWCWISCSITQGDTLDSLLVKVSLGRNRLDFTQSVFCNSFSFRTS